MATGSTGSGQAPSLAAPSAEAMHFLVRHHGGGSLLECPRCHHTERLHVTGESAWLAALRDFQARHRHL